MKYLRKAVEVDVIIYDGGNVGEVKRFCPGMAKCGNHVTTGDILIPVADGSDEVIRATRVGTFITKDPDGDFSVFDSDKFNETHELSTAHDTLQAKADLFDELSRWLYTKDETDYVKGETTSQLVDLVISLISKAKELK